MTYRGHVKNGVVVLDEPANLPDGAEVRVELPTQPVPPTNDTSLAERLLKFAGLANGLPSDAAVNHDHYLYGAPKK